MQDPAISHEGLRPSRAYGGAGLQLGSDSAAIGTRSPPELGFRSDRR